MRRIRTLYIAGPHVHYVHADAWTQRARRLCEAAGYEALLPAERGLVEQQPSEAMAREIYAERAQRMRRADAAIVDLSPFRGPHCDPAAAFEAGFFSGLRRPVFAWMNVRSEFEAELCARVEAYEGAEEDSSGVLRDSEGAEIEDLGLPECLMLWAEARRLFVIVTDDPQSDLTGLEHCLEAVKVYAAD